MNFKPSRTFAEELMNEFIENNLVNYSKLRNFDYGPDKRSNVSCLSPYVTHGVISEVELIKKSLNKYSFVKNEKFIQEIMWRTFWKGWMELRPDVWADYLLELNQIKDKYKNDQDYKKAVEGSTEIQCFNEWVGELKQNNYLLFVDGSFSNSKIINNTYNSTDIIEFGYHGAWDKGFIGLIDDVRIYDRALSADEVQALYNLGQ